MLLIFEATLCTQRFRSLEHLRGVRKPPRTMFVFRDYHWRPCSSDDLVPGDVASLSVSSGFVARKCRGRLAQLCFVPCDAVVLRGSCVVNEAMLTGESVPQRKDALALDDATAGGVTPCLDIDGCHRRHVIFGGTELLDVSPLANNVGAGEGAGTTAASSEASSRSTRPGGRDFLTLSPPDRGVVVHVVRTGFQTSQGNLMRIILYATERVVGSTDSAAFICVLLMFAVAAACYVLYQGLQDDPPRNRFKLCLHVSVCLVATLHSSWFVRTVKSFPPCPPVNVCSNNDGLPDCSACSSSLRWYLPNSQWS